MSEGKLMRILLATVGSSGDVHPFIAIARALRERGHEVVLATNPYFRGVVEGAGIGFASIGERIVPQELAAEMPGAFKRFVGAYVLTRRVFLPHLPKTYEDLLGCARSFGPDVIVGHQIAFGVPWIAEELGIPWGTCVLAPATMLSNEDPGVYPIGMDVRGAPMAVRRMQHWFARRAMSLFLDGPMNRFRKSLGRGTRSDTFFGEMLSGSLILGMWSSAFRGSASDDPETLRICGFPWFDRKGSEDGLEPGLEAFLNDGEAPIVVTLGSVLSHVHRHVYEDALRAIDDVGVRAVLVTGHEHDGAFANSDRVYRADYVAYSQLLHRGAATVHHGGVGTTAQALRAGKPVLVLPHAHDQFDNAARCEALGVGLRMDASRVSVQRLRSAFERLIGDDAMRDRSAALGRAVGMEDGGTGACAALEANFG